MTFSCTKKVIDHIKKYKDFDNPKTEIDFFNWYVDLVVIERKKYFLFTHATSLFSFFIYVGTKKEINQVEQLFEKRLGEMIVKHVTVLDGYVETLLPKDRTYTFNKTNSRKVLGSMNDFKNQMITVYNFRDAFDSACYEHMNRAMVSIMIGGIKYKKPQDKIKEEIEVRM